LLYSSYNSAKLSAFKEILFPKLLLDEVATILELILFGQLKENKSSKGRDTVATPSKKPRIKAMRTFGVMNNFVR
jgi:hypothetical protein